MLDLYKLDLEYVIMYESVKVKKDLGYEEIHVQIIDEKEKE